MDHTTTFDRGPWAVRPRRNGKGFLVLTDDQTIVARIPSVASGVPNANAAGNARFIAAAPELRGRHLMVIGTAAMSERRPNESDADWAARLKQKLDRIEEISTAAIELAGGI